MSAVVIKIDDVDITDDVFIKDASFTSLVNGQPGPASLRVKDINQTYEFTSGGSLTLDIDGDRVWGGYVMRAIKSYLLIQDTTNPEDLTRVWTIAGVDYNVLFNKRIIYNKPGSATAKVSWSYDASTYDDTIIEDIFDNYLDLDDDDLTRAGVQRIAHAILDVPGKSHSGQIASAGMTWKQMMDRVARETGGVYYIDGSRDLHYVDVETVTSDYSLADTVGGGVLFQDNFNRTVADGWGNGWEMDPGDELNADVDGDTALIASNTYVYPATNPAVPDVEDFDLTVDWKVQDVVTVESGYLSYIYFEMGSSWFDAYAMDYPTSTPYDVEIEVGSNGMTTSPDLTSAVVSVDADSWYTIRWAQFGGSTYVKIWKRGDPEPDDWMASNPVGIHTTPAFELDGPNEEPGQMDNLVIRSVAASNAVGFQSFSLLEDGTKLINDMFVWGSALGSDQIKFSRTTDSASVTEHGRRQNSLFSGSLYRQASLDIVADSYVYGTPQSHRGGKDNAVTFTGRVFEPVFRAGQVVDVTLGIYGYSDALPIRVMKTTFANPTDPIFDLTLGHDIDEPVGIFEQEPLKLVKVRIPDDDWTIGDPPPLPDPEDECQGYLCDDVIIDDNLNRSVSNGWGGNWSTSDPDYWDSDPTSFSVNGSAGTIVGQYVTAPFPDDPWIFYADHTIDFDDELLIKFRVNDGASSDIDFSFYLFSTIANDWSSAEIYKDGTDLVCLPIHSSGGSSVDDGETTFASWDGEWLWCRMRSSPLKTEARFWKNGDTEPSTWKTHTRGFPIFGPLQFVIGVLNTTTGVDYSIDVDSVLLTSDRCSAVQFDDFARTVPSGWGQSSDGHLYTLNPGGGTASVSPGNGGFLRATVAQGAADVYVTGTGPWSGDYVSETVLVISTAPTSGVTQFEHGNGHFSESKVYIEWGPEASGDVPVTIGVYNSSTVSDTDSSLSFPMDQFLVLEWEHNPTDGFSRARIYPAEETPPAWQVSRSTSGDVIGDPEWGTSLINNLGGVGTESIHVYSVDFFYAGRPCYIDCGQQTVLDDFEGRTLPDTWGTSSSGLAWSASVSDDHSVAGGLGILDGTNLPSLGASEAMDFPIPPGLPLEIHVKFRFNRDKDDVPVRPSPATGNNNAILQLSFGGFDRATILLMHQWQTPSSYFTRWRFLEDINNTSQIVTTSEDIVSGVWYEMKGRLAYGEALRGKLWTSGDPEPPYITSTVVLADPTASIQLTLNNANPTLVDASSSVLTEIEFINLVTCGEIDPDPGVPSSGDVCETIHHSGGGDFATSKAFFSGSLKIWVNGARQTAFTFDAALGEFHLTGSDIESTDLLYVCYRANGDPA